MSADLQATHAETVSLRRQVVRLGEEQDLLTRERNRLRQEADQAMSEREGREAAQHREAEEREAAVRRRLEERDEAHCRVLEKRDEVVAALRKEVEDRDALLKAAADEAEATRVEHERRVQEWSARAAKAQEVANELDRHLTAAFPGSERGEEFAVVAYRRAQLAAGAEVGEHAPLTVQEVAVWCRARLSEGVQAIKRLQIACLGMVHALWPNCIAPSSMSRMARWLEAGPARLDAWRASAAHARAAMALRVTRSWYPGLDLGLLAAQRVDSEAELEAVARELATRASDLASFAPWDEYVPERTAAGNEMAEDLYGLAVDDPEGSVEESGDDSDWSSVDEYADSEPAPGGASTLGGGEEAGDDAP